MKTLGFTLIEVLIAMAVLAIGFLAIIHLFPVGQRVSKISQDTTVATFLAQQKIEELKNEAYADLIVDSTIEDYGDITGYEGFRRVTTIQLVHDPDVAPGLKRITVEVFYELYGSERSVKLVTLRTDYNRLMPLP